MLALPDATVAGTWRPCPSEGGHLACVCSATRQRHGSGAVPSLVVFLFKVRTTAAARPLHYFLRSAFAAPASDHALALTIWAGKGSGSIKELGWDDEGDRTTASTLPLRTSTALRRLPTSPTPAILLRGRNGRRRKGAVQRINWRGAFGPRGDRRRR